MDVLTGQSLEMSLTHEDSPPPLTQVEGKVESLDSATYLGAIYLFDIFFLYSSSLLLFLLPAWEACQF